MGAELNFYRGRVALNVLAKDKENGRAAFEAADGYMAVGVLSARFDTSAEGTAYVEEFSHTVPIVSVGLGSGDPNQWRKASDIAVATGSAHVNQSFTAAPVTKGRLIQAENTTTLVNSLISPTGQPGKVKISTGPLSSEDDGVVDTVTAIKIIRDMAVDSVKFFPMEGLRGLEELKAVARACARYGLMLEPTGGIDPDNFTPIVRAALDAGVERMMVHVYNSIIDPVTGETRPGDVANLFRQLKQLL